MNQKVTSYKQLSWGPVSAIIGTIAIFFGAQVLAVASIYAFLSAQGWDGGRIDTWIEAGAQAQFVFSIAVAIFTISLLFTYLQFRKAHPRELGLVAPRISDLGYAILGFLAYMAINIMFVSVISVFVPGLDTKQTQELGFSRDATGDALLLIFISLVILPPIVEEIMVRGFLFSGLRKRLSFVYAALVSSILFGLAHLGGGEGGSAIWIATIDTFILGMVLAYLREKTGSLWSPIVLHGIKNGIAFLLLFIFKDVVL